MRVYTPPIAFATALRDVTLDPHLSLYTPLHHRILFLFDQRTMQKFDGARAEEDVKFFAGGDRKEPNDFHSICDTSVLGRYN
jgi:hypothetical protein